MSAPKQVREYATETLNEIEGLLDFIDGKPVLKSIGSSPGDAEGRFRSAFPAVYLNRRTHKGETELLGLDEILDDCWPFDHSAVFPGRNRGPAKVCRIRSITRKEAAGKVRKTAPRILCMDYFFADEGSGIYAGSQYFFGAYPDGTIKEISKHASRADVSEYLEWLAFALLTTSVSSFYDWHVVIGRVGSPIQVKLPATSTSAREFLALRDVPEGMQRRAAIKHWVSKHERLRRTPEEYDVRAHLRGREEFTWGDYEGWVEPSQHDIEKSRAKRQFENGDGTRG